MIVLSHAKGRVLEVAAGTGRNFDFYPIANITSITCTDTSIPMLEQSKQRKLNAALNTKVEFLTMDAHHLQFDDEQFDTVVDTFGLCSFSDPVQTLKEMKRVCKKDGTILLLEHGQSSNYFLAKYLDYKVPDPIHTVS